MTSKTETKIIKILECGALLRTVKDGWNCTKDQARGEAFVTAELNRSMTWGELVAVASGHAPKHVPFEWIAGGMGPPSKALWQTNKDDHEEAKRNKLQLAETFRRSCVLDEECEREVPCCHVLIFMPYLHLNIYMDIFFEHICIYCVRRDICKYLHIYTFDVFCFKKGCFLKVNLSTIAASTGL